MSKRDIADGTSSLPIVVQGAFADSNAQAQVTKKGYPLYDEKKQYEYPLETTAELWQLPPGWRVARQEADGRLFYQEMATGRMSWVHPMANQEGDGLDRRKNLLDTPMNASRRPDSHQCCACVSLLTCLPMGVCALFHSHKVDQAWKMGNYGDAVDHSRQAHNYACWGSVIGIALFLIWWFRNHDFEFPDWDLGD
jgi:hypothetical protein